MTDDKYFYQHVLNAEIGGTITITTSSCDNNEKEINKVKNTVGFLRGVDESMDVYNKNMTKYLQHLSKMKKHNNNK